MGGLTPIVLAAGASSRMGRPKALLDFDGKTCLERVLDAFRGQEPPIVVLGPDGDAIRQRVPLSGAALAFNPLPGSGPSDSLRAALRILPPGTEGFFFMPVDCPLITAADVARLVEASRATASPVASIFIPSHNLKRGHPVLCRRELAEEFLALPDGGSARDVIRRIPSRLSHVLYPDAYVLMDMDTPEDYGRCLEAYRRRHGRPS